MRRPAVVSTNHPTNQPTNPYRQQRCGPYAGARRAGRFAAVVCGPPGACRSLRAVRDGGRGAAVGDSPVRREVTLA